MERLPIRTKKVAFRLARGNLLRCGLRPVVARYSCFSVILLCVRTIRLHTHNGRIPVKSFAAGK